MHLFSNYIPIIIKYFLFSPLEEVSLRRPTQPKVFPARDLFRIQTNRHPDEGLFGGEDAKWIRVDQSVRE